MDFDPENSQSSAIRFATSAEKHDYLTELQAEYYKRLIDFAFRHGVFLTLVLGWIVSSEQAQKLILYSLTATILGAVSILGYALGYSWWVIRQYRKSEAVCEMLLKVGFMDPEFIELERIQRSFAQSFIGLHWLISLCAIGILCALHYVDPDTLFKTKSAQQSASSLPTNTIAPTTTPPILVTNPLWTTNPVRPLPPQNRKGDAK